MSTNREQSRSEHTADATVADCPNRPEWAMPGVAAIIDPGGFCAHCSKVKGEWVKCEVARTGGAASTYDSRATGSLARTGVGRTTRKADTGAAFHPASRPTSSASTPRRKTTESWVIWTSDDSEQPRRGFGQESLDETLDHLRKRGDRKVSVQVTDVGPITEVSLAR